MTDIGRVPLWMVATVGGNSNVIFLWSIKDHRYKMANLIEKLAYQKSI